MQAVGAVHDEQRQVGEHDAIILSNDEDDKPVAGEGDLQLVVRHQQHLRGGGRLREHRGRDGAGRQADPLGLLGLPEPDVLLLLAVRPVSDNIFISF